MLCFGSLAKGHSGDTCFLAISCPKGHAFVCHNQNWCPVFFHLEGVMTIPQHSLTSCWCWGSRSPQLCWCQAHVSSVCLAEVTCRPHSVAPVLGPSAAQASLCSVVALNTSLNFCANDMIPLTLRIKALPCVSSYHPFSSSLRKQNQNHIHNNPPE